MLGRFLQFPFRMARPRERRDDVGPLEFGRWYGVSIHAVLMGTIYNVVLDDSLLYPYGAFPNLSFIRSLFTH